MAATARAAKTQSGVRLVAQPPWRSGTNGGSVCVGEVIPWSPFTGTVWTTCGSRGRVHQAQALGELGLGHRAEHVVDDAVLRVEEERLRKAVDVVGKRHGHLRVKADR